MADSPNVLVVLTDQQRWDTVGAYGAPMDLTPNLDEVAAEGTRFEHSISSQPVCAPTRGCLQTGQYATTHGVWKNNETLRDEDHLLARVFSRNGYDTGYVGKWHLGNAGTEPIPEEQRAGYDHWLAADLLEFTSHPYEGILYDEDENEVSFDGYRVDAMTDMAIDFIREDRDDPFFLFLSYLEPHHQNDLEAYVAPDGYDYRYQNPWVPPDLQGNPGDWYEELPDYYGICRRIDECFGRLVDEFERQGIDDDTTVVFTSDHGSHFRTRNDEYKRSAHEASVRVPTIIQGPGFDGGGVVEDPISLVDLPPTLLDSANIRPPEEMEGQSAYRLVEESDADWKDDVFIQISETEVGRALRTNRWKYSVYAPEEDGRTTPSNDTYVERHLYDLHADPYERTNLVGREEYQQVAGELRSRLADRIEEIEDETVKIVESSYYG